MQLPLVQPQTPGPPSATQLGADGGHSAFELQVQTPPVHPSLPGQSVEAAHWPQAPWEQPGRAGGQSAGRRHSTQACVAVSQIRPPQLELSTQPASASGLVFVAEHAANASSAASDTSP